MALSTFVQLFITKRIINLNPKCTDQLDWFSIEQSDKAKQILTFLSATNIQQFMMTKYNHDNDKIISIIFNKLITNYPNEYNLIVSFENNCIPANNCNDKSDKIKTIASRYYENKLFNQTDLIPKIFQFLPFGSLNVCCLVNSIWLYHSYNINSIYRLNGNLWLDNFTKLNFIRLKQKHTKQKQKQTQREKQRQKYLQQQQEKRFYNDL